MKKAQLSYIEIPFALLIFSITLGFFVSQSSDEIDFSLGYESFFNSLLDDENFREKIFKEDFQTSLPSQDYSTFKVLIEKEIGETSLIIKKQTNSKVLFNCTFKTERKVFERLVFVGNLTNFSQIVVRMEVCL